MEGVRLSARPRQRALPGAGASPAPEGREPLAQRLPRAGSGQQRRDREHARGKGVGARREQRLRAAGAGAVRPRARDEHQRRDQALAPRRPGAARDPAQQAVRRPPGTREERPEGDQVRHAEPHGDRPLPRGPREAARGVGRVAGDSSGAAREPASADGPRRGTAGGERDRGPECTARAGRSRARRPVEGDDPEPRVADAARHRRRPHAAANRRRPLGRHPEGPRANREAGRRRPDPRRRLQGPAPWLGAQHRRRLPPEGERRHLRLLRERPAREPGSARRAGGARLAPRAGVGAKHTRQRGAPVRPALQLLVPGRERRARPRPHAEGRGAGRGGQLE